MGDLPTHSHLPWSIFMGDLPILAQSGLFLGVTSPHTDADPSLFSWVTYPNILKLVYFQKQLAHTLMLALIYVHGQPAQT